MNLAAADSRVRWVVAATGGFLAVAVVLLLFRVPAGITLPETMDAPSVTLADAKPTNAFVTETALMHDLAPLFLPTEYNASLESIPRPQLGRGVLDVEETKFTFSDTRLAVGAILPPVITLNGKPLNESNTLDALASSRAGADLAGFGRQPAATVPAEPRGAFVEVVALATGERVLAEALPAAARAPTDKLWQPPRYLAVLDAAGLVGPLRLAEGSRVEEVDQHFQRYLASVFRLGQRLPPGFYRVTVSP